ncbi:MAG: DUF4292 domain-containing protein, partial [Ignavibacteria bacterium]|nr:DUF4292 domain-containing protein [Ignavibacteria bacterium]
KLFSISCLLCLLFYGSVFSQEEDSTFASADTLIANGDTLRTTDSLNIKDSLNTAFLNNPERLKIIELISSVNETSIKIDLLHSENVVKIKTPSLDATGEIEIKMKRNDDIWFRISGGFAFVSKDAFIAHFNREKFIYFDNLDNKVIEGPTTEVNIGIIARIKCSFDDLMNVMSGACTINYTDKDTLTVTEDESAFIITVKGRKILKYWIDKETKCVNKYAYINRNYKEYLRIIYSNFSKAGNSYYARKVEITRPNTNEFLKVVNENFTLNNPVLTFKVNFPYDARRVVWDR